MIWLRSLVYNIWFVGSTIVLGVFGIGVRMLAPRHSLWLARLWARTLIGGARVICNIQLEVIGREHLPTGAALIASQHQSAFDTLVWLLLVEQVAYVYKAELHRVPLVGALMESSGQIKLDRGASMAAVRSLFRGADRAVAQGRQIVIFPEGTRVLPGAVSQMRPGVSALASRTGLPVIPVATDSGRLWSRQAFIKRPGTIHLVIRPPIPARTGQAALLSALRAAWEEGEAVMARCG